MPEAMDVSVAEVAVEEEGLSNWRRSLATRLVLRVVEADVIEVAADRPVSVAKPVSVDREPVAVS